MTLKLPFQAYCLFATAVVVAVFFVADVVRANAPADTWGRLGGWLRRQLAHAWAAYTKPRAGAWRGSAQACARPEAPEPLIEPHAREPP